MKRLILALAALALLIVSVQAQTYQTSFTGGGSSSLPSLANPGLPHWSAAQPCGTLAYSGDSTSTQPLAPNLYTETQRLDYPGGPLDGCNAQFNTTLTAAFGATFTGSGSSTNLTASAVTGLISIGDTVVGSGVPGSTTIISQTSGTPGGAGVYVTSGATTSSGASLTTTSLVMSVSAVGANPLLYGMTITGTSVTAATEIVSQISGTTGGAGLYTVNLAQTVASEAMTAAVTGAVDLGNNGMALAFFVTQPLFPALYNAHYTAISFSWGINDVRQGLTTYAAFQALLQSTISTIRANSPNTDIILRIPDTFLSTDPTSSGFVVPPAPAVTNAVSGTAGVCRLTLTNTNNLATGNTLIVSGITGATGCNVSTTITIIDPVTVELAGTTFGGTYASGGTTTGTLAQASATYSALLRSAYLSLVNMWPNVVVFDAPTQIFGTAPLATSAFMSDILHPNANGYIAIARGVVKLLNREAPFAFSQALLSRAQSPTSPYTVYNREVEDSGYYTCVVGCPSGALTQFDGGAQLSGAVPAGATTFDINFGGVSPLGNVDQFSPDSNRVLAGDLVQIGTGLPWAMPSGSSGTFASANVFRLQTLGSSVPASYASGTPVSIYRPKFYWDSNVATLMGKNESYPTRYLVSIGGHFNNVVTLLSVNLGTSVPVQEYQPQTGDVLAVPGNATVTLGTISTTTNATGVSINMSHDFSTLNLTQGGGFAWVFSPSANAGPAANSRQYAVASKIPGTLSTSSVVSDVATVAHVITPATSTLTLGTAGTVTATTLAITVNGAGSVTATFAAGATAGTLSGNLYVHRGDVVKTSVTANGTSAADLYVVLN